MKTWPACSLSWLSIILAATFILPTLSTPTSSTPFTSNTSITTAPPNDVQCTRGVDWLLPAFTAGDCIAALQIFHYGDYLRYNTRRFEFHNHGVRRRTRPRIPSMRAPKRYVSNRCTFAIAMLHGLEWPLPGQAPHTEYVPTDVVSFREVFESVRRLELNCVISAEPGGWERVGREGAIGVFVYATNSAIDMAIEVNSGNGGANSTKSIGVAQSGNVSISS